MSEIDPYLWASHTYIQSVNYLISKDVGGAERRVCCFLYFLYFGNPLLRGLPLCDVAIKTASLALHFFKAKVGLARERVFGNIRNCVPIFVYKGTRLSSQTSFKYVLYRPGQPKWDSHSTMGVSFRLPRSVQQNFKLPIWSWVKFSGSGGTTSLFWGSLWSERTPFKFDFVY